MIRSSLVFAHRTRALALLCALVLLAGCGERLVRPDLARLGQDFTVPSYAR